MGRYNIHAGHCPQGQGASGAVGYLAESVENRKVAKRVISALINDGHVVFDCTDNSNCNEVQNLRNIVSKCNGHAVDLDISIHLNAGGGTGVEVWCYDRKTADIANAICRNISNTLGIANRGIKYSQSLYVLKKTAAPAILVECCFVDNRIDYEHWNAHKCGDAIASAVTGKALQEDIVISKAEESVFDSGFDFAGWVGRLQNECNRQGFSKQKVDCIPGPITLRGCPMIRRGASGNITRLLQERLNSVGFSCVVDGAYGRAPFHETYDAVLGFQKSYGLVLDGIVGVRTWSKLLGLS